MKKQNKEEPLIKKFIKRKSNKKSEYLSKRILTKKCKNAKSFTNVNFVLENGIIKLKTGEVATLYSVNAIDLSLSSNNQKDNFFHQLKLLYQVKDINLRIYKLDDKMDLNANKDYYKELIDRFSNDKDKIDFLEERYSRLENIEKERLTTTSRYFFVLIADNEQLLDNMSENLERQCVSITPKLNVRKIINKLEIYQFLTNLYLTDANLEQLMWSDLIELISPSYVHENVSNMSIDDDEIQILSVKMLPPFIDELFFEQLFNVPNVRCCIHVKDTIPTEELIRRLDSNYEFLLADMLSTRKLSDATEMDLEKHNFQELMTQLKNGNEKIKEVDFVVVIKGTKKQRDDKIQELKCIANEFKIKLDIPRMRQYEAWQSFDLRKDGFDDYHNYLPSLTLSASFPLTVTNFNDPRGYMFAVDIHTGLPMFFDMFYRNNIRPSSNLAVVASTGGGKSFTLKKMIVNEITRGNKVFIFDAEGEYKNIIEKHHGEYIDLYSASHGIINPLQVRFLPSDVEEKNEKEVDKINYDDCPLAKHLGSLETFIKCAFEEIKESEVVVMLDMIEKLYKRFGITKNTKISNLEKLENTDYPIFTDLINFLPDYRGMVTNKEQLKIIDKLEILLDRFKVGIDAMLFNGYTTVNLDSDLIAFNVKDLLNSKNVRLITTQLVNLLTYLNNIIVSNKIINDKLENKKDIKNIAIIVDEFHLYIKGTDSEVILTFEQIARRIRKYHGAFIPATQSIHDFLGDDNSVRSATAIFNNCQYQLVGMLKEDDLSTYLKLFSQNPLTDTQREFLLKAEQGEFLLTVSPKERLGVKIIATPLEAELMMEELHEK